MEQLAEEKNVDVSELLTTTYATGDHARPSTISVYITSTGKIKDVDFYDYCKCVLPNEWYSTWKTESLKAGAQAVKFVGWYRVYNAKYPGKGYDVKDSTVDQAYKEGTEVASCTNAINAVGGIGWKILIMKFFILRTGRERLELQEQNMGEYFISMALSI